MNKSDLEKLVRERAYEVIYEKRPAVLLGSGHSLGEPYRLPGMSELGNRVADALDLNARATPDLRTSFRAETTSNGYEKAVDVVPGMDAFTDDIIEVVQTVIGQSDFAAYERLVLSREKTGFGMLLDFFANSSGPPLVVMTTNYDRVVEYECGLRGTSCFDGFADGYIASFSDIVTIGRPAKRGSQSLVVDLYKVHGSLGWFIDKEKRCWRLPLTRSASPQLRPVMIVPGVAKFRETHEGVYRKLISASDPLIRKADSILVIGYGFHDSHIQEPIRETSSGTRKQPIVVLTRSLTEPCEQFLRNAKHYMALSKSPGGTLVTCNALDTPVELPGVDLWRIDEFMKVVKP